MPQVGRHVSSDQKQQQLGEGALGFPNTIQHGIDCG